MNKPAFIITIDTEGDNLWNNCNNITTKNTYFLPRFQELCETYQLKTTWLTNYEMIIDPAYIEFAKNIIANKSGEIGMHLHAYNSPPIYNLTGDDLRYKPYLIEYPKKSMKEKIIYLTSLLEDTLQVKMHAHRAGRWAFNTFYAQLLIEQGYQVDCSVTPRINWARSIGDPKGSGGVNYQNFPDQAYFIDEQDIAKPGSSTLLEVPVTTQYKHGVCINQIQKVLHRLDGKQHYPTVSWFRPQKDNARQIVKLVKKTLASGKDYVEFMLHSSELMPGGSPTFKTKNEIERLYHDLEQLFEYLHKRTISMQLSEYYAKKLLTHHRTLE
ncbi:Glycoside hydrolase/deacetylase, beta/alpha-barrel superfamily protein [Candidatus Erwinia haradaeae]|uniref:Glycoside hydrolase/deacetylase, beta/alpha-barrel superfamily protein n=1 Tax=Candidatus Erwinia haradaeae TaxID=1922217 RepID=A0A451DJB2_9GAMM|nr:deacetylase [Candidatus Erwinia haradaeae]VFP86798.1 Glycoside hydrolase/deacetylase, beta/alpha-barrel superfamily protein [Candidatus Erwinia haradaeae]